ncbi:MAG: hypothetical protein ABW252_20100 [Polyangiales bacterium]
MNRSRVWMLAPLLSATLLSSNGCDKSSGGAAVEVEKLPDIKPDLPAVPTLPPPPHPVQYPDGAYSVFGLRKRIKNTMDTEVDLTAYVVETYRAPECPEGKQCPQARAPHVYLADAKGDEGEKRILLVGYAENQKAIDEALVAKKKGKYKPPPAESGMLPIPTDLFPGAKVKVKARFTRVSGAGFAQSDGLLDYRAHTAIEPPTEIPEPVATKTAKKKRR